MCSTDYLKEKLNDALFDLALGEGDARSRLDKAYHRFWHIKAEEFPDNLQATRKEIDRLLTRLPSHEGYIIPENLRRMKNKTASKIAEKILDLYFGIVRHKENA